MNDDEQGSSTGRAEVNGSIPRQCPLCELGHKATERQAVVEIDFSGVELRVLYWAQKDADGLVEALRKADSEVTAKSAFDSYVDPRTFATAIATLTMPVTEVPVATKIVKRKNAPKGKRGRAQWWNR